MHRRSGGWGRGAEGGQGGAGAERGGRAGQGFGAEASSPFARSRPARTRAVPPAGCAAGRGQRSITGRGRPIPALKTRGVGAGLGLPSEDARLLSFLPSLAQLCAVPRTPQWTSLRADSRCPGRLAGAPPPAPAGQSTSGLGSEGGRKQVSDSRAQAASGPTNGSLPLQVWKVGGPPGDLPLCED